MKMFRKLISVLAAAAICFSMLPAITVSAKSFAVGNTDLNILNGGVMLSDGEDLYFNHNGIFVQKGETVTALSADNGVNLNLSGEYLYYTLDNSIVRMPKSGGTSETLYTAPDTIKQMYVLNDTVLLLSGGQVYSVGINGEDEKSLTELNDILGLIPTSYGNIYLRGQALDYTVWAGDSKVLSGVAYCYTDSGYLVISINGEDYMVSLSKLFGAYDAATDLQPFTLHGSVSLNSVFAPDDENMISEYNDNYDLVCDYDALLIEEGLKSKASASVRAYAVNDSSAVQTLAVDLTEGQKNIVKRARQLMEIEWTPLENIPQWDNRGTFKAETTYYGIPYGQPVNTNGYIGYGVSLEQYSAAVLNNTSKLYTTTSNYNKVAPTYSTDCSGFVSYTWGLTSRKTTYSIRDVATKVGDQSLYSLQVGDCLNKVVSHVVLITDISYDADGKIIGLEVSEQTPVITRKTLYGAGQSRSLASFQSYYLDSGYEIYRNPNRDSVTYNPSTVVPLDGEIISGMTEKAPKTRTTGIAGGKTVELYSDTGAAIYYTTDGSTPTVYSNRYTGALSFSSTTKLRAIAVSSNYSGSTILEYTVKVPQLGAPTATVSSGESQNGLVSSGSKIALSSVKGATIYYTTDGSTPTTSSRIYSAPITVTSDVTIKAMAQANGYTQSNVMTQSYKIAAVYKISASAGSNGTISPSGSVNVMQTGSKTFSIKANSGYAVADVLVDGVSVGAVTSYTFSNLSSNHSISASFKVYVDMPFKDISSDAWYYDAVCFAYSNNLFNGMSDTMFMPDTTMQRGMFTTVLGRFAGLSSNLSGTVGIVTGTGVNIREGPSTDTNVVGFVSNKRTVVNVLEKNGDWYKVQYGTVTGYIRNDLISVYNGHYTDLMANGYYSVYVQWAYLTGVANGVADSVFRAEEPITREDMCLLMYNYATIYGKTLPVLENKTTFSDDAQISPSAKTAVYALQQAGIIKGMGNNVFSPKGTATRGQVAQIYKNFVSALS